MALVPDPTNPGGWLVDTDNRRPATAVINEYASEGQLPNVTTAVVGALAVADGELYFAKTDTNPKIAEMWERLTGVSNNQDWVLRHEGAAIRWTNSVGPHGLEMYCDNSLNGVTLETALYYRAQAGLWAFEDAAGNRMLQMEPSTLHSKFGGSVETVGQLTVGGKSDGELIYIELIDEFSENIKIVGGATGARPYISFWNLNTVGTAIRKGIVGYPSADNENVGLSIEADVGQLNFNCGTSYQFQNNKPIQVGDGSLSQAQYSFYNSPTCGLYLEAVNVPAFTIAGAMIGRFSEFGVSVHGATGGPIMRPTITSKTQAGFSFWGDPDTGVTRMAADEVHIVAGATTGFYSNATYSFIPTAWGSAVTGADVWMNNNGRIGYNASSVLFKREIEPLPVAEALNIVRAAEVISFKYVEGVVRTEEGELGLDDVHIGLSAESLDAADDRLSVRTEDGTLMTYDVRALVSTLVGACQVLLDRFEQVVGQPIVTIPEPRSTVPGILQRLEAIEAIIGEDEQ